MLLLLRAVACCCLLLLLALRHAASRRPRVSDFIPVGQGLNPKIIISLTLIGSFKIGATSEQVSNADGLDV